jgi:glutaredoxin-like protein NrdH
MSITVWSKPNCVQCRAVYRAFDKAGTAYEVKNLPDFPEELEAFKDMGLMGAPVVEAAGFPIFSGFDPDAIKAVIQASPAA